MGALFLGPLSLSPERQRFFEPKIQPTTPLVCLFYESEGILYARQVLYDNGPTCAHAVQICDQCVTIGFILKALSFLKEFLASSSRSVLIPKLTYSSRVACSFLIFSAHLISTTSMMIASIRKVREATALPSSNSRRTRVMTWSSQLRQKYIVFMPSVFIWTTLWPVLQPKWAL